MGQGVKTKDAELQEGHQLEFCSVATASITSNTPIVPTAFPELSRREDEERKEEGRRGEEGGEEARRGRRRADDER
jgi:hypothetical protein